MEIKHIPPSEFPSKGEDNLEMEMDGLLPVCLAELKGFPVTAKDSAAFDSPGGYCYFATPYANIEHCSSSQEEWLIVKE